MKKVLDTSKRFDYYAIKLKEGVMTPEEVYKKQTGVNATYRVNGADWHTLKYVKWLEEQNAKLLEALKAMIPYYEACAYSNQEEMILMDARQAIAEERPWAVAVVGEIDDPTCPGHGTMHVQAYDPQVEAWLTIDKWHQIDEHREMQYQMKYCANYSARTYARRYEFIKK